MFYKPKITPSDAKRHLHDIRYQRQKELAFIIDECHQLRMQHKYIFDNQFNSYVNKKSFSIKTEVICQEDNSSIADKLTDYLSESSSIVLDNRISNNRLLLPRKMNQQKCLSVSSVASIDKRANKVYEKWPDYTEISQIVGYRIEKITPPVIEINQKKRKKSSKFANVSKQIKCLSSNKRDPLKNEPLVIQKLPVINISPKEIKPKLPSILCPSSEYYSKRIQTRQWLVKNYFSSQTVPLI